MPVRPSAPGQPAAPPRPAQGALPPLPSPAAGRPAPSTAARPGAPPPRPASSLAAKAPPPPKRAPDPPPQDDLDDDEAPTGFFVHSSPMAYDPDGPPSPEQAAEAFRPMPAAGRPAPPAALVEQAAQLMDAVGDSEPPTAIAQAYQEKIPGAPAVPSDAAANVPPGGAHAGMPGLPPMPGPPPRTMAGTPVAKRTMMGMPAMQYPAPAPPPPPAPPAPAFGAQPVAAPAFPHAAAQQPFPSIPQAPVPPPGVMPGPAPIASAPGMQAPFGAPPAMPPQQGYAPQQAQVPPMAALQQAISEHASRGGPALVTDAHSHPSQVSRPFHTPTAAGAAQMPDPGAAPGWLKAFAFASIASAIGVLAVLGWMLSQRL